MYPSDITIKISNLILCQLKMGMASAMIGETIESYSLYTKLIKQLAILNEVASSMVMCSYRDPNVHSQAGFMIITATIILNSGYNFNTFISRKNSFDWVVSMRT
ncbi:hypothetical protein KR94_00010 [Pantoea ananatis]|nr:hypothetical protein KR94_00010 [Pantoea ananatis]